MKKTFFGKKIIFAAMAAAAISMPAVQMAAPVAVYAEETLSNIPGPNILGKYTDRNIPGAEITVTYFGDNFVFAITSPKDDEGNQYQWAFTGKYDTENNVINYSAGVRYLINSEQDKFELDADGLTGSVVNKDGVLFWNPVGERFDQGIWDRIPGTTDFNVSAEVYNSRDHKKHGTVTVDKTKAVGGEIVRFDVAMDEGYKVMDIYAYTSKGLSDSIEFMLDESAPPGIASFTTNMPEDDVKVYFAVDKDVPDIPELAGGYDARENKNMHMDVYKNSDGTFYAQIDVPEDDVKSLRWTFSGEYDPVLGHLRYNDGKKFRYDTGNFSGTNELIYEDGTGSLVYKEGTLFWNPDKEPSYTFDRAEEKYSVNINVAPDREDGKEHGLVSMDEKYRETAPGESVTVTGSPEAGYRLAEIVVTDSDGSNVETTKKDENSYSFTMPASDVEATAIFVKDQEVVLTGSWANRENAKNIMHISENKNGGYDVVCIVPRSEKEADIFRFSGTYDKDLKRLGFDSSKKSTATTDANGDISRSAEETLENSGALIYKDGILFLNIEHATRDQETIQFARVDTVYNIKTGDTKNGKVNVNKTEALPGEYVIIKTDPEEGFATHNVSVLDKDGKEVEVKRLGNNAFIFYMPESDVTVSATFVDSGVKPAPVNPTPGYNGGTGSVVTTGVSTGDTNMMPLWVSLAAASAGVAVSVVAIRRKKG